MSSLPQKAGAFFKARTCRACLYFRLTPRATRLSAGSKRWVHSGVQLCETARGTRHEKTTEIYAASNKPYKGLPELSYPFNDLEVLVTSCGRICKHRKRINLSSVLAGQRVGIKEIDEGIWTVSFTQ